MKNIYKYKGTRLVKVLAYNAAFGLVDLYIPEFGEEIKELSVSDSVHIRLYKLTQNEFPDKINRWGVKIVDGHAVSSSPNHCGLGCQTITYKPRTLLEKIKHYFQKKRNSNE